MSLSDIRRPAAFSKDTNPFTLRLGMCLHWVGHGEWDPCFSPVITLLLARCSEAKGGSLHCRLLSPSGKDETIAKNWGRKAYSKNRPSPHACSQKLPQAGPGGHVNDKVTNAEKLDPNQYGR